MPKIHLTDTVVQRDCVAIDDKTTWYSDTETTGLQLCVTPAGAKTWYLHIVDDNRIHHRGQVGDGGVLDLRCSERLASGGEFGGEVVLRQRRGRHVSLRC